MKGKKLSFPFICFLESGLFNGLRPIQIKISSQPRAARNVLTLSFGHTPPRRGCDVATGKGIARNSVIRKSFVRKSASGFWTRESLSSPRLSSRVAKAFGAHHPRRFSVRDRQPRGKSQKRRAPKPKLVMLSRSAPAPRGRLEALPTVARAAWWRPQSCASANRRGLTPDHRP